MKHYSNSPKDSFFNTTETSKKLPLLSVEAYNILSTTTAFSDISSIVSHFNQLVNKDSSVLKSHHYGDGPLNNQVFIKNLNDILARLTAAVNNKKPYQCLFGDVAILKEYLQVILGYYQEQLKQKLPDAKAYEPSPTFWTLMSSIARHEKPLIDEKESQELAQYVTNHTARDVMKEDMQRITNIVMNPFMESHPSTFSYC